MTVSIDATNLVLIDAAEATTGWTSSMGGLAANALGPREGTNNLQDQASEETYEVFHTITAENYNGRTIFGWQLSGGPDSQANDGFGMYLGDVTNKVAFTTGGVDNPGFPLLGYSLFRLNVDDRPTDIRTLAGSEASIDEANITEIGYAGNFPGKAAGNADNVKFDVLRYCINTNPALLVEGGTTGARGTYQECVTADESTATGDAFGIFRILTEGSKAYEQNFGVQMGSLDADSFFDDSDFQVYLNGNAPTGASIAAGSMDIDWVGDSGSTNVANLDNFLYQGLGTVSNWTVSADIDTAHWSNGQFVDMGTFTFPAQDAGSKDLDVIIWTNCGQIYFDTYDADNITINGSTDANGAILWDEDSNEENQDNITFNSDGTGHAIEVAPVGAGPFTFNIDGYTFDGFAGQSGTAANRVFLIDPDNNDADTITINITDGSALNIQGGGDGFSFELGAGVTGTPNIVQTVTLVAAVVDELNVAIPYATVSIQDPTDDSEVSAGIANNLGIFTDSTFNYTGDLAVNVVARKSSPGDFRFKAVSSPNTIINTGLNAGVGLAADPNAGLIPMVGVLRHGVQSENVNDAIVTANLDVPAGTTRKLVVAVMYWASGSDLTVSAATYDGDAMTSINSLAVGAFNEVFLYRHDIPDGDDGVKVISFTLSASVNIKAIAFAVLDDVATGAEESADTDSGNAVTSNPSLDLNNTTADSFSIGFGIADDLDSPTATGDAANRVRRSDVVRDAALQSVTILVADRASSGAHSIGADFGGNSKTWVYAGASFAKN